MIARAAWQVLAEHSLRSVTAAEDRLVVYQALHIVAGGIGLIGEADAAARVVEALKKADALQMQFTALLKEEVAA